ncbi:recombinase XerD [Mycobacterium sp. ENV421]|uniref:tyrosine-type recombinase/integrase n=1 Tax=Mycolicibacterium tusciae TaxID=75922 RepID=UPI00024A1736|nr:MULTISPECIES: tyrosine-type recombinase/integrase [Mycobacteriaceae]PND54155.1 recombinase XerD [Mycobacterium sp. ENV421]
MRAFPVSLPSGQRYWTVLDEDLHVVGVADEYLRHLRFGRDAAESTTKAYAHSIALFLRWCARSGRSWQGGVEGFALFIRWLAHAGGPVEDTASGVVAGPGAATLRCPSRINGVLTAVRGMVVHAVATGTGAAGLVSMLYEVADDRDLPAEARGEDGRMAWRMRARHRLREPETTIDRASDEQIVAILRACRSARDRLIVLLMARGGLRRGELCGLRRSDVHLLVDSRRLGCEVARAHLHVVRREDNSNEAWAKSRRQRVVPLDFLVVQVFDVYEFERMRVADAANNDFVFVNLFRGKIGKPMRPDAIGELMAAASRRAGLDVVVRPHQLRHAYGSNVVDAGAGVDVVADLLGHAAVSSSQVYLHPDSSRLRAAVDAVPSPRELGAVTR